MYLNIKILEKYKKVHEKNDKYIFIKFICRDSNHYIYKYICINSKYIYIIYMFEENLQYIRTTCIVTSSSKMNRRILTQSYHILLEFSQFLTGSTLQIN